MNIVVLGQPASGKGTQAELLTKKLQLAYLEMGDVLREVTKKKTPFSKKIDWIMHKKGVLVSDAIIKKVASDWLDKREALKGIVFDGYPRKLSQYQDLEEMLEVRGMKIDKVIYLDVSDEISIKRIESRRICSRCDAEYNLITKPPRKSQLCDQCQVRLSQRQDDKPEVVKKRLKVYHQLTEPLIDYVRQQRILIEIDGERPIEAIHQDIMDRLKQ